MEIAPKMRFIGNVNGVEIEILKADTKSVTYRDLATGCKFNVGRMMFEHLNISRVKQHNMGGATRPTLKRR